MYVQKIAILSKPAELCKPSHLGFTLPFYTREGGSYHGIEYTSTSREKAADHVGYCTNSTLYVHPNHHTNKRLFARGV